MTRPFFCARMGLMLLKKALQDHDFPAKAVDIFLQTGIKSLYPPQAEAVKKGVLKGKSLLMSVPTAAGKTLIAELAMARAILLHNGRCLYIAPLKALASEKYQEFKKKFEPLGVQVGLAIGDMDSPSRYLNRYQIIVATAEKVDSLLRSKAKWLLNGLSAVVLDEIHFINDGARGPTLEILTTRIKQLNKDVQFIALSATVKNASDIAGWLGAELVHSAWRPIPLKEGVYYNGQIVFEHDGTRKIVEEAPDEVSQLTLDTLRGKGQVLIFVGSRRSAQAVARQVAGSVAKVLTDEEKQKLQALSKKVLGSSRDATKICHKLADCVKHGAAFHHAGLKPRQRELIETNFKENLIKVIGCTPTLAAGVNLPARRAIIRDCKRFEAGVGAAYIPTSEYKQCAGRAGRPQYDDYGEAVLVAKSASESATLFERYIQADPEPIYSKLGEETALRTHLLASIAGGYVHDVKGMLEFLEHTFMHHQQEDPDTLHIITEIFDFLEREKFIEKSGYRFFATPLGALTSRLYIDPLTAITLREGIDIMTEEARFSPVGVLHLMTCTADCPRMSNIGKALYEHIEHFATDYHEDFLLTPQNSALLDDFYGYLATLKTTWVAYQWIEEEREDKLCDFFNVGPGDIYRHTDSIQWLLYACTRIAELMGKKRLTFDLEALRTRVRHGIKEELLELVQLKGVGRIRARLLFEKGIRRLKDLNYVSKDELAAFPTIGKALAEDIKKQLVARKELRPRASVDALVTENAGSDEWVE